MGSEFGRRRLLLGSLSGRAEKERPRGERQINIPSLLKNFLAQELSISKKLLGEKLFIASLNS
jgi:hypothetical protein